MKTATNQAVVEFDAAILRHMKSYNKTLQKYADVLVAKSYKEADNCDEDTLNDVFHEGVDLSICWGQRIKAFNQLTHPEKVQHKRLHLLLSYWNRDTLVIEKPKNWKAAPEKLNPTSNRSDNVKWQRFQRHY